ncbi:MAG: lipoate--protein ligase [Planctomycetia bacterium]|nr:lipoate--protein ligase [Planctomycetia bacterium]
MKIKTRIIRSTVTDPYRNLAVEELLLEEVQENEIILFLWQNKNTVVIGRNQNALTECNLMNMDADGVFLARRMSGGGAVYHDLGNLNFTFVAQKPIYDLHRQQRVILFMAQKLGFQAEISGRNDITIMGRKFSGNAFLHRNSASFHHGTILIHTDSTKMARYLNPSPVKLQRKGVPSVRSRVINLVEIKPDITVNHVIQAFQESFQEIYHSDSLEEMSFFDLPNQKLETLYARNRERHFNLGDDISYSIQHLASFPWGTADIRAEITDGYISQIKIYCDSLDPDLSEKLEQELSGRSLFLPLSGEAGDILKLLSSDAS